MGSAATGLELDFLVGGGEMGKCIGAMDWSASPLGPIEAWPQSLRTTVSLCLASNFPISLAWGPRHTQIYNDGYWPICGAKHPTAMGQDYTECWASAWPAIGEAFERGLAGEASYIENQRMFLDRNGYLEETFFTFSFSPIRDESGGVGGLFHPVTEQTGKMLSDRRRRTLLDVAARTGRAKTLAEVFTLAAEALADHDLDLPFALLYALHDTQTRAELVAHVGMEPGTAASPLAIDVTATVTAWPLGETLRAGTRLAVDHLEDRFGPLSCGPYPESPKHAIVLPIFASGSERRAVALLVTGISARLPVDEAYLGFLDLLAAGISAAVTNARAYEEERRRAEMLAELDLAKTAFFNNVSHEFRTPLALMLGPIEDALADTGAGLPATQRGRLEVAHRNALRLLKLVNTLLDFSRIEAGRAQGNFEPVDLAAFTAELVSNFRSACERAGLRLVVDCTLPRPVRVDRDMWEKIVLNLVSNAFKFTFEGEIAVSLRAAGEEAELAVRDTGIGVPEHELPKLFERFHRVEGARGRTHEGSGIGLALVQELVKLHGGAVSADSAPGLGSTFLVRIPLGAPEPRAEAERQGPALSSTTVGADAFVEEALRWLPAEIAAPADAQAIDPVADAGRPRILLADDNADMREYVERVLREGGYDVCAVADGEAALTAVRAAGPFDLILSDVMMPRLDGFGLLRQIRGDRRHHDLPIVMLSARAGEEASVGALDAGADDYLIKPFGARELVARVRSTLQMARLRRATGERERQLRHEAEAAQEALRQLNETLEQRVESEIGERRKAEASLFQAQKMEAIGQLTGGLAHDFNNLLGIIVGNIDELRERHGAIADIDDRTSEALEAALRGADLTRSLLAFARKQPLQPRRIDVNQIVAAITKLLMRTLGENIEITLKLARDPWPAIADPVQLEAALTNLATNARDAMPQGGRLVIATANRHLDDDYVRQHADLAAGDYVAIEVSDTGSGIDKDRLSRIFDPFFTTKAPGQGTGLGLSMVFGYMKQSGGHVSVYSEIGVGTTFRLYLPRTAEGVSAAHHPKSDAVPAGRGETVLVVEDNAGMRNTLVRQLHALGYAAAEAENVAEALVVLDRQAVDLLLTDIIMPGGASGLDLAEIALARSPAMRVILTSGFPDLNIHDRLSAAAVSVRLLNKPYRKEELARLLREALDAA